MFKILTVLNLNSLVWWRLLVWTVQLYSIFEIVYKWRSKTLRVAQSDPLFY